MQTVEKTQRPKNGIMLDKSLIEWLKDNNAKTATKMVGPNGAFISWTDDKDTRNTIPVGHNSQEGKLNEFNLIEVDNGDGSKTVIATVNHYEVAEQMSF